MSISWRTSHGHHHRGGRDRRRRRRAVRGRCRLADAAARSCLERAHRSADDIELLINAGVYFDRNISEPAIAALIQEDIGANLEQVAGAGQGTLSFDVRNGACGLLTAST